MFSAKRRGESQRRRYLRTVEQRKAFFRRQRNRLEPGTDKGLFGRQFLAVNPYAPYTNKNPGQVCEWCQVTRCPNRALGRNGRINIVFQQSTDCVNQFGPYAGMATCKRFYLHEHDQANNIVGQQRAHANGM